MNHFEIVKAAPPADAGRKIPQEFFETLEALEPGEAFSFPVDLGLKDPLAGFRHHGRKHTPEEARYRWLVKNGAGWVYRTR